MTPSYELCAGSCTLTVTLVCHMAQAAFPVITFVGASCGMILAVHGVIRLALHYFRGKDIWKP